MDQRSPEEVAGGFIRCRLGTEVRNLPTLKISDERAWKESLAKAVGTAQVSVDWEALKAGGDRAYHALTPMLSLPTDIALEMLVAYDKSGALGGREWLERNADSKQVYDLLVAVGRVVFPFVHDLRGVLREIIQIQQTVRRLEAAAEVESESEQSSSTNGLSPTGTSTPSSLSPVSTPPN